MNQLDSLDPCPGSVQAGIETVRNERALMRTTNHALQDHMLEPLQVPAQNIPS